jgi:hypothetical protein
LFTPGRRFEPSNGDRKTALAERVQDLIRLARDQGFLTNTDVHDAFAEDALVPHELAEVHSRLRGLEIEIVDETEVEAVPPIEPVVAEEGVASQFGPIHRAILRRSHRAHNRLLGKG